MAQSTVTVIIPAYNEEKTVGSVLSETSSIMDNLGLPYEIILVDDGSTDKTGLIASSQKVILLSNNENHGKGYCLRRALKTAHGNIIVTMDSDGEHRPKEIPDLVNQVLSGVDVVSGSRFLGTSSDVTAKINRLGNSFFNLAIMLLTGKPVTDSQTGFRAIKKEIIDELNLKSDGYEIETEITMKSLMNGFICKELPITCQRRKHSASKVRILYDGAKILKAIVRASTLRIGNASER